MSNAENSGSINKSSVRIYGHASHLRWQLRLLAAITMPTTPVADRSSSSPEGRGDVPGELRSDRRHPKFPSHGDG